MDPKSEQKFFGSLNTGLTECVLYVQAGANDASYTCQCQPGYYGGHCEFQADFDICSTNPCENSATCLASLATGFTCTCPPGFQGMYYAKFDSRPILCPRMCVSSLVIHLAAVATTRVRIQAVRNPGCKTGPWEQKELYYAQFDSRLILC